MHHNQLQNDVANHDRNFLIADDTEHKAEECRVTNDLSVARESVYKNALHDNEALMVSKQISIGQDEELNNVITER